MALSAAARKEDQAKTRRWRRRTWRKHRRSPNRVPSGIAGAVDAASPMRDRWAMRLVATIVIALSLGLLAAGPCRALSEVQTVGVGSAADAPPQQTRRPKTRLRVRPIYPYRHTHSIYPVPYRFDYPGPNAKRECVAR